MRARRTASGTARASLLSVLDRIPASYPRRPSGAPSLRTCRPREACVNSGNECRCFESGWNARDLLPMVNAPSACMSESKMIYLCTAHIFKGDTISTVGIDGDFLSGFNIPWANEYLLALMILINPVCGMEAAYPKHIDILMSEDFGRDLGGLCRPQEDVHSAIPLDSKHSHQPASPDRQQRASRPSGSIGFQSSMPPSCTPAAPPKVLPVGMPGHRAATRAPAGPHAGHLRADRRAC